jgi:hypothetical protein
VHDHTTITVANFLEKNIICTYGVSKFILIDDGGEWVVEFVILCNNHYITP